MKLRRTILTYQPQVPDYKAEVCVAFARGNIGKAKSLASSEDFDKIKNLSVVAIEIYSGYGSQRNHRSDQKDYGI